jgi:hypothetical protein
MKSMPENTIWSKVSSRLKNYEEPPDEHTWERIATAIPRRDHGSTYSHIVDGTVGLAVIISLLLLFSSGNISLKQNASSLNGTPGAASSKSARPKKPMLEREDQRPLTDNANPTIYNEAERIKNWMLNKQNGSGMTESMRNVMNGLSGIETNSWEQAPLEINGGERSTKASNTMGSNSTAHNSELSSDTTFLQQAKADTIVVRTSSRRETRQRTWRRLQPRIYFSGTPSSAFYKITPFDNDGIVVKSISREGIFSSNRFGYQLEGGLELALSEKLDVFGGLNFYAQNQRITYSYLNGTVGDAAVDGESVTLTPGTAEASFSYAMRNAGAHLGFLYTIKDAALSHRIGAALQYQVGYHSVNKADTYENAQSQYLNYQLVYRLELDLSSKVGIYLQPVYTHSFRSREQLDRPFTMKPYRAGIGFGFFYRFK